MCGANGREQLDSTSSASRQRAGIAVQSIAALDMLHHGKENRGVELQPSSCCTGGWSCCLASQLVGRAASLDTLGSSQARVQQPPDAAEEPVLPLDLLVRPIHVLLRRRGEEDEQARGSAPYSAMISRGETTLPSLGHLLAVARLDDPCVTSFWAGSSMAQSPSPASPGQKRK